MKKEIADKWAAALRSGEYKQTTSALNRMDSFCCLGVLCEVVIKDGLVLDKVRPDGYMRTAYGRDASKDYLPREVVVYSGMKTHNGAWPSEKGGLAVLNDSGVSFQEIADIIERNWEEL